MEEATRQLKEQMNKMRADSETMAAKYDEEREKMREAMRDTDLPRSALPAECPYCLAFLRDHDAMPE